ncbi:MFS transporter [Amycolatopsis acidicola]|uniref:MFS transporter n=1 Tax=Amycolatopsis acidicola TaxID=2596893 RepID=A0A5N0V416_9PSEU|nr:MFS transporter [Amycolatopsis acidicola]KAA9159659.1 MFS transporter [Amycolatopsis acidicola]
MMSGSTTVTPADRGTHRSRWNRTVLACIADYLDAGSIVGASAALALWTKAFGLSPTALGVLAALGVNAGSYAVGSLIGGRLGDLLGRKRIYQWDLLVYVAGGLILVFAAQGWMLFAGLIVMGLAVGADVPTSWALIGEIAPARERGRFVGMTSVFWNIGPVVTLVLAFALSPLGLLGARIVFAHLVVVAVVTWLLRLRLAESEMWVNARNSAASSASSIRELFRRHGVRLLFVFAVHTFGSIAAGTFGFFLPYILKTIGTQSQAASVGFNALSYVLTGLGVGFLYLPLVDRVNRRLFYGAAGVLGIAAILMLIFLPLSNPAVITLFIVVNSLANACSQEQFYRLWCQELFPTLSRATAQGIIIFAQKLVLAGWSVFVPVIVAASFHAFSWILAAATAASVLIGLIWMPRKPAALEEVA